ncbi:glutathione S-transferase C-terminal-like protein [Hygrophoropsis aurantiaca]|uniref:Glutathione S-transferase C-terminal-like protein n=1 Tax=Hygrophoropsis aurantiaca TaxID=72124 RepID=A0ACB8A5M5_9AGAM|nr:glutathione S-transferase C-terminal-like protein [Hygrophoropsis aurantiaca]
MAVQQITSYRFKASPYGHRVELALAEAKAPHKVYDVDLFNKPEWFVSQINPAGKVPVITYGGPDVAPENPSPLSEKIAESGVILEFIADLYPDSGLLPKDPVARAKVRFFIETVSSKFLPPIFAWSKGQETVENVLKGVDTIQDLLSESGEFAVGNTYTIADAAIIPFIAGLKISYENDIGNYTPGEGHRLGSELQKTQYAKFMRYSQSMLERQSTKDTFDVEHVTDFYRMIYPRK